MLETHYLDQLEALEIFHANSQRVYPDQKGHPRAARLLARYGQSQVETLE